MIANTQGTISGIRKISQPYCIKKLKTEKLKVIHELKFLKCSGDTKFCYFFIKNLKTYQDCLESKWLRSRNYGTTVKLGNKEQFDKEQIGIKGPFPVTNLPFTF